MQRRPLQLKTYLTAVTKRELEKIFRLVWDLNRLPSAILGAALTSVESEAQELRNSFCFLVFVIVVVMVAYIKLLSIVKHHDRQVLSILSNDWWIRLWFSWFLLKADHSWVLNYDIRWSANFFFVLFQIFVFIIFSFISTLLGLEIVSYYTYTGAAHWSVYLSSRNYLIIASVTYFFAVVEIIIGICAVYVSLLLRRNVRYLIFLLPVSRSCIIHRFKALNTEKTGPFKETMKCL